MVNLTIDQHAVCVSENTTIMEAAKSVGIQIPSLCYLKGLNEIGACRICCVEVKGRKRLITACNNVVTEGMEILTNSPNVRRVRRNNIQLILSQHDCSCPTCVRSGHCELQKISNDLGVLSIPYQQQLERIPWNPDFPLIRDSIKCIKCMRCIQVCDQIQGLNVWDVVNTGSRTTVDVSYHRVIENADCALCGQCVTHCPTGALRARDDTDKVFEALADQDLITVVQIAPAVRASWGEGVGLSAKIATERRLAATLRRMGFDYVFDTDFAADLTIMEEGSELLERLKDRNGHRIPMFTSCCPGWVRYLRSQYPELTSHLSSAKSPQQMFGAVVKSYFAKLKNIDPKKIFCVSIMPCIAKKYEAELPNMCTTVGVPDVDVVLTTREISRMIRADHLTPDKIEEEDLDDPFGTGSGAGVIFGTAGGVMEAALRSAHYLLTGENPKPDAFSGVQGKNGYIEADFKLGDSLIRTATVSGLNHTKNLIDKIKRGEAEYDFIEVMACPGGCSGGGGQPIREDGDIVYKRSDILCTLDRKNQIRFSHENQDVQKLYEDFLGKPLSEKAHELLHTDHEAWTVPISSHWLQQDMQYRQQDNQFTIVSNQSRL